MIMPEQNLGLELLDMLLTKWQPYFSQIPRTVEFKSFPASFWFCCWLYSHCVWQGSSNSLYSLCADTWHLYCSF